MDTINILEELVKAADRIKGGIRKGRSPSINHYNELLNTINTALASNIPNKMKRHLASVKEHVQDQIALQNKARPEMTQEGLQEARVKNNKTKEVKSEQVRQHLEEHPATKVPILGHEEQYIKDTTSPAVRSKQAMRTSPGVKERVWTGEGIALQNKPAAMDKITAHVKNIEEKIKQNQPPITIRVPQEHQEDEHIKNLVALREHAKHPDDFKSIDDHISKRITELSSKKV